MDIRTLQSALARLAEDRADDPLQAPKNIALSLGAEAGILQSLFRGLTERQGLEDNVSREIAAEALTSILVHVAQLSNHVGLDASAGLRARIKGRPSPPLAAPNTVPVVIPRSVPGEAKAGAQEGDAPAVKQAAADVAAPPVAPAPEPQAAKAEAAAAKAEPSATPAEPAKSGRPAPPPEPVKAEPVKSAASKPEAAAERDEPRPAETPAPASQPEPASASRPEPAAAAAGRQSSRKRGGGVIGVKVDAAPASPRAPQSSAVEVVVVEEDAAPPEPARAAASTSGAAADEHDTLDPESVLDLTKALSRELDRSTRDDPVLRDLRDEIETLRRSLYASNTKKAWLAGSLRSLRTHLEETLSHSFAEDLRSEHFIGRIDVMLSR